MTQNDIPDETLMAYADGELAPEAAARLETRLAEDPALAGRLAAFTKTRAALGALKCQDAAAHAMPPALEAALRAQIHTAGKAAAGSPQADGAGKVLLFRRRSVPRMPLWAAAAAASLALAVGLGGGLMLGGKPQDGSSAMALAAALDRVPSGAMATLADGTRLSLVSSFQGAQGAFCREYKLVRPSGAQTLEVACDAGSGWETQLMLALAESEGYAPAAAPELLDLFYTQSAAGAPLSTEAEAAALAARQK